MSVYSIQRRLVTAMVLIQVMLAIVLVAFGLDQVRRQLLTAFDEQLQARALSVAALVRYSEATPPTLVFESSLIPAPADPSHPDEFQITLNDGTLIARSAGAPSEWTHSSNPFPSPTVQLAGTRYRGVSIPSVPILDEEGTPSPTRQTLHVIYASPTNEMDRNLRHTAIYLILGAAVAFSIFTTISIFSIRRGLQPLADLARSAAAISPSNWNLELPPGARSTAELQPLTVAMTAMLQSLQKAFRQQSEFLANAAHELKTPLAVLKSTLQSTLHKPRENEEYRRNIGDALNDVDRLEKLMHTMLRIARAENGPRGDGDLADVDVAISCQTAMVLARRYAESRNVEVNFSAPDQPIVVRACPEDLELVWSNLLENAIRHSPTGSTVEVKAAIAPQGVQVEVLDSGPGIAESQLNLIFDRFHRSDSSRSRESGGYGLGLSISRAIVEAYRGSIVAENRTPNGARFIVTLPLASSIQ